MNNANRRKIFAAVRLPLAALALGLALAVLAALHLFSPDPAEAQQPNQDFDTLLAAGNEQPFGLWSNGDTMWVSDYNDNKIYAYNMSTKARESSNDFNTLSVAHNRDPAGIWSNGDTMWVADFNDDKIYAYSMSDKQRDSSKDFNTLTAAGNREPRGIWSDGDTMWVADGINDELYAYNMDTKARDESKDFDTLTAAGNNQPTGIWSNGNTMWVVDSQDQKLYAYRMSDGQRVPCLDLSANAVAGMLGLWSDGSTFWIADQNARKIFSFTLACAQLADLTLSDVALDPAFDGGTSDYLGFANTRFVDALETAMRLRATPHDPNATVVVKNNGVEDADASVTYDTSSADQVITVEVTGGDGVTTQTYRVEMATKLFINGDNLVDEGGSGQLSLQLNKKPSKNTTVTLSTNNPRRATLTPTVRTLRADQLDSPLSFTTLDNEHYFDFQLRVSGRVTNNDDVHDPDDFLITIVDDDYPVLDAPRNFSAVRLGHETTFWWQITNVPPLKRGELLPFAARVIKGVKRIRYDFFVRPPGGTDDDWIFIAQTGSLEVDGDAFTKTPDRPPLTVYSLPARGSYEFAMRALGILPNKYGAGHPVLSELSRPYSEGGPGPYIPDDNSNLEDEASGASGPGIFGPMIIDDLNNNDNGNGNDQSAPSAPWNLAVTQIGDHIKLTWRAAARADSYHVQRRLESGTEYTDLGASTNTAYTDTTATVGVSYAYRVQAVNDAGSSEFSAHVLAELQPPPTAPTDLVAAVGEDSVTLTWTASDDDSVVGYLVARELRDADPATIPEVVGRGDAGTTSVTDDNVDDGASYTYSVFAIADHDWSEPVTVNVDVAAQSPAPRTQSPLTGFTLVDASDQNVLATLTDGTSVELADPNGASYGVKVDLAAGQTVGSVSLALSGAKTVSRTENVAPYSLYGDGGANALRGQNLPAGSYTLTATAYADSNLGGDNLGTMAVSFTVTAAAPPSGPLTGFTLVDASDQAVLSSLTSGASVGLDDPNGGSYAIRADVDSTASIGSVRLELSGASTASRTENYAPYSLHGDGGANALYGGSLPAGSYTLTATAYENRGLGGDTLGTLEITFTVTAN